MKLIKLVFFDLRRGVREEWLKFIFAFIVCIGCCSLMCHQLSLYHYANGINEDVKISLMDFIIYNLRGMKLYSPNMDGQYLLPAVWMFNQVMIALIVGYYPVRDLEAYGKNTLLRTKSRVNWFLSKIIWTVFMVVVYYLILYIATFVFCVCTNNLLSIEPTEYIMYLFYDIDLKNIYVDNFIVFILTMPIATSVVASVMQVILSYIVNPFISFITVIVMMLSSTYIANPALIGNASMVIRSRFVSPVGFTIGECSMYLLLYLVIALVLGIIYFRKKDILNKG